MEKMEVSTDIVLTSTNADLDDILMQLDTISETLDQLEGMKYRNSVICIIW